MTQFKIGDEVIMTADRSKGTVWKNLINGEYKGRITNILTELIEVTILGLDPPIMYFPFDGIAYPCTGMSIRLAKEDALPEWAKKMIGDREKMPPGKCELISTPSQWVEGQIPKTEIGKIFHVLCLDKSTRLCYRTDKDCQRQIHNKWQDYTHYCPATILLPPSPPVKEVEAFGFLEYCKKDGNGIPRSEALKFYSQPATAENLEKYIKRKGGYSLQDVIDAENLDEYIKEWKGDLLFTPAALDMLGVK